MHRATHWGIFEKYRNDDEEDARKQPSKLTALGPGPELKKKCSAGQMSTINKRWSWGREGPQSVMASTMAIAI